MIPAELPLASVVESSEPVRRGTEFVVTLDDGTQLQLMAEVVVGHSVRGGANVTDADLRRLLAIDHAARARAAALRMLARHPRTNHELAVRLARRGFAPDAIDAAVRRLEEAGLLDDEAFARRYVDVRSAQPRGRRLLVQELRQRGVGAALAREAVEEVDDAIAAEAAARARLPHLRALDRDGFYRRLGSFLQRRGFGYDISRAVLEALWREAASGRDDVHLDD